MPRRQLRCDTVCSSWAGFASVILGHFEQVHWRVLEHSWCQHSTVLWWTPSGVSFGRVSLSCVAVWREVEAVLGKERVRTIARSCWTSQLPSWSQYPWELLPWVFHRSPQNALLGRRLVILSLQTKERTTVPGPNLLCLAMYPWDVLLRCKNNWHSSGHIVLSVWENILLLRLFLQYNQDATFGHLNQYEGAMWPRLGQS